MFKFSKQFDCRLAQLFFFRIFSAFFALNRYFAIVYPLCQRPKRVLAIIAACWAAAFAAGLPAFVGSRVVENFFVWTSPPAGATTTVRDSNLCVSNEFFDGDLETNQLLNRMYVSFEVLKCKTQI